MTVLVPIPLYGMQEPCIYSMTSGSPITYMDGRDLITINDLVILHNFYGMWEHTVTVNDCYGPLMPYMECRNLVTVNDS